MCNNSAKNTETFIFYILLKKYLRKYLKNEEEEKNITCIFFLYVYINLIFYMYELIYMLYVNLTYYGHPLGEIALP